MKIKYFLYVGHFIHTLHTAMDLSIKYNTVGYHFSLIYKRKKLRHKGLSHSFSNLC